MSTPTIPLIDAVFCFIIIITFWQIRVKTFIFYNTTPYLIRAITIVAFYIYKFDTSILKNYDLTICPSNLSFIAAMNASIAPDNISMENITIQEKIKRLGNSQILVNMINGLSLALKNLNFLVIPQNIVDNLKFIFICQLWESSFSSDIVDMLHVVATCTQQNGCNIGKTNVHNLIWPELALYRSIYCIESFHLSLSALSSGRMNYILSRFYFLKVQILIFARVRKIYCLCFMHQQNSYNCEYSLQKFNRRHIYFH